MSWRRRDPVGAAGLLLFLGLAILPVGLSLVYAALYSLGLTGLLGRGLTWSHWRAVLGSRELWASLGLSAGVALGVVAATTAAALGLALSLRERVERGLLSSALYLPLALPGAVAAFFVFQMLTGRGLVPRVLFRLGLLSDPAAYVPLVQDRWAVGIVLAHVGLAVPFFTLLFADLYRSERIGELAALARSLGASPGQCIRRVEVPLLLRAASANLALLFIVILGSYEIPLLLGRQAPQMLSVLTLRKYALFDVTQKPQAFVVALVYTALVLALIAGLFRGRRPLGS